EDAGDPASQRAHTGQPQAGTPPEVIQRPEVRKIDRQQASQRGDWKVDKHRVQRVAGYRSATVDGISVSGHLALRQLFSGVSRPARRAGDLLKWTTLALAVPLLSGCGGPL